MKSSLSGWTSTKQMQWLLLLVVSAVFLVIPYGPIYTQKIAFFLSISVFCIGLVCLGLINIYVPAFLMPSAYVFFGVADWQSAMSGWANSLPGILFSAFIISSSLEKCGLIKRMAYYAIIKTRGSYVRLCFAILIVGWIASLMTSCNAHMIMIIIGVGIAGALGFKKFDIRTAGIFMAVALGTISSEQWQYYPSPMSVMGPALQRVDPSIRINWADNIIYCWPMAVFAALYLAVVIKFFLPKIEPVDLSALKKEYSLLGTMSFPEKKMVALMALFMFMLITSVWTGLDIYVPFILIPLIFFMPGIELADSTDVRQVPYEMIILISSCMSMGTIASQLGISHALGSFLTPLFHNLGLAGAVTALWASIAGMNIILTPIAIYSAFGETFMRIFESIGINPHAVMFLSIMGGDAIFLPHEHMYYLVLFSFGLISMKNFVKLWAIKLPFQLACILFLLIPYWKLIGFIQ